MTNANLSQRVGIGLLLLGLIGCPTEPDVSPTPSAVPYDSCFEADDCDEGDRCSTRGVAEIQLEAFEEGECREGSELVGSAPSVWHWQTGGTPCATVCVALKVWARVRAKRLMPFADGKVNCSTR